MTEEEVKEMVKESVTGDGLEKVADALSKYLVFAEAPQNVEGGDRYFWRVVYDHLVLMARARAGNTDAIKKLATLCPIQTTEGGQLNFATAARARLAALKVAVPSVAPTTAKGTK